MTRAQQHKAVPHGTANAYQYYRCRCAECTRANTELRMARRRERFQITRMRGLPAYVEHGVSAYRNWGCRCERCTTGNRESCRDWKDRAIARRVA